MRVESQPVKDPVRTRVTLEVELSEPDVGERRSQHARVSEDDHRLSVRSGLEKLSHRVDQAEGDEVVEETQTEHEGRPEVRPSQVNGHGGKEQDEGVTPFDVAQLVADHGSQLVIVKVLQGTRRYRNGRPAIRDARCCTLVKRGV